MLFRSFDIPENEPIINELLSLLRGTDKRKAKDDSVDSMRYGVTKIQWDWSKVGLDLSMYKREVKTPNPQEHADAERARDRKVLLGIDKNIFQQDVDSQLEMWGELFND